MGACKARHGPEPLGIQEEQYRKGIERQTGQWLRLHMVEGRRKRPEQCKQAERRFDTQKPHALPDHERRGVRQPLYDTMAQRLRGMPAITRVSRPGQEGEEGAARPVQVRYHLLTGAAAGRGIRSRVIWSGRHRQGAHAMPRLLRG